MTIICLPYQLRKAYAVLWAANRFFGRRHLNTMTLTNFENLNSILERFHGPSNYLYLFKSNRQTFSWQGNVRHSTSKLLKCDLVQTLNTFRNPSLRFFCRLYETKLTGSQKKDISYVTNPLNLALLETTKKKPRSGFHKLIRFLVIYFKYCHSAKIKQLSSWKCENILADFQIYFPNDK